ncbi:zyxin [Drosophila serrata]|uniref:zyxin n=1 Tax=Drosophila serrata TaxID=7274 RepID=UPI000A1CFBBE|nr:zyxin [Drosophila serrata]
MESLNHHKPQPKGSSDTIIGIKHGKVAELVGNIQQQNSVMNRKTAPTIPPKPHKKRTEMPQVPSSKQVTCSREPLYSQPLLGTDNPLLFRKHQLHSSEFNRNENTLLNAKKTLDNPDILEQQLEALAYHKLQMERKGLLGMPIHSTSILPNLSPNSSSNSEVYTNITSEPYRRGSRFKIPDANDAESSNQLLSVCTNIHSEDIDREDDVPPPPSPVSAVSSSYSELRRASSNVFNNKSSMDKSLQNKSNSTSQHLAKTYTNQYPIQQLKGTVSKSSSTYDSIYEPINPRPSGDHFPRDCSSNLYGSFINDCNSPNILKNSYDSNVPTEDYTVGNTAYQNKLSVSNYISEDSSIATPQEFENYGRCVKCNSRVLGESSGCTAMDQIYHISCFTCSECQINLQGKPFYALDGKPYCEYDYLQTLEKCSVCMEPILERILRATGKPYHPQCFTCVVCGKSLDGLLFTVDATNQNYCITDFHKKFAPRCCVCKEPIMPEIGQDETVRVVALDRSFHLECYKCEDCGLLLSSEAEGRGCYPLDDHVLCKSCNAKRVQVLTKRMT